MIYFISDTHFGHDKDFIYEARGYHDIKEHDNELIREWNSIVKENDEVYHLGDMCLGMDVKYNLDCVKRLNGKIHLIRGNHDSVFKCNEYKKCRNIVSIYSGSFDLKYKGYTLLLSHYPTLVSNKDDAFANNKIYSLHGHTHSKDMAEFFEYRSINVAADIGEHRPFSADEIISFITNEREKEVDMV